MSWEALNLRALPDVPPVTPSIDGLVYPGRRHVFSGPHEGAKTFAALCLAVDEICAGRTVLHIDFEMFAFETRDRLLDMGLSGELLDAFVHVEPETPATENVIAELVETWEPSLVIIDAAAGAYALHALDDHKRLDAERFAALLVEPFRARDVATVVLDHVTKNAETRGKFSIGSERKIGGTDVHLGFEPVVPFGRGRAGLFRIVTHEDRFGHLPRPRAAELELRSDPLTGAVTWAFRPSEDAAPGEPWLPTELMEKVSRYLEQQDEPVSRNRVEKDVGGKGRYLRQAIDELVASGHVRQSDGPNRAKLLASVIPYSGSSRFAPGSSGRTSVGFVPSSLPLGDEDTDELARSNGHTQARDALSAILNADPGHPKEDVERWAEIARSIEAERAEHEAEHA